MKITKISFWGGAKLYEGEADGYYFYAQVFSEPSRFGIADGRISRLCVSKHRSFGLRDCLVNYDRGWDGGPPKGQLQSIVEQIVRHFDQKSVDWCYEERR